MKQHFVTFCSPGRFVAETTSIPIDSWDVEKAVKLSKGIQERYGALPYGFYFTTRERGEQDLDSKRTATSSMYYLGGEIRTLAELKAESADANSTLISTMEGNGWDRVIINRNSWQWTQPLLEGDVVLAC